MAMRKYLNSKKGYPEDPLFSFSNGKPLTRHSCLKYLRLFLKKAGYPPEQYNTHSFRIGAATHAAHMGIPAHHIKLLGRWRSTAYQRYTRTRSSTLKKAASQFAISFNNKHC